MFDLNLIKVNVPDALDSLWKVNMFLNLEDH